MAASFRQKLAASFKKNLVVAGTGAALVILSGDGFDLIPVFGHELPRASEGDRERCRSRG